MAEGIRRIGSEITYLPFSTSTSPQIAENAREVTHGRHSRAKYFESVN